MRAAVINVFGNPEVFEIMDIEEPHVSDQELMIEVAAGSVNPVDYKQRMGNHRFIFGSPFPIVLGYDVSGIVVKTGRNVSRFKPGDRVCGVLNNKYGGGLAQFARGHEKCFARIGKKTDLAMSASLPLSALTALQVLRDKAKLKSGKKILIIGAAGGVGHYALQIAAIFNARIFALSSAEHEKFVTGLVTCSFLDYMRENIFENDRKFDIIFDTIGKYPFPKCVRLLNPGGIHVNILPRPKILFYKLLSVFTAGKKCRTHLMKHNGDDLQLLADWLEEGKLKICIEKEFPLSEIGQAHNYIEQGHTEGKILIRY
jgi:NADPH:quinone reductase-like Zn-dependent oxidoreductase